MEWPSFFTNNLKQKKRIYLDHAGATEMSARAKRALIESLENYGNPSALYEEGVTSKRALASAKKEIANVLSCQAHELYITGTGTESVTLALMGVLHFWEEKNKSRTTGKGILPHIITTEIEHPAVRELCKRFEKEKRVRVTYLSVDRHGLITKEQVKEALSPETILVTIMQVNNEVGSIMPIKEIGRMISLSKKEKKSEYPYFHTDACQAVNYLSVDVHSLRVDLMTINSSKIYGPKGIGLLYKNEKCHVSPVIVGGGQERGLRSGTEAVALVTSFAEAMKETRELRDSERERLFELVLFTKGLLETVLPAITFYASFKKEERIANNLNFRLPGIQSDEMIVRLDSLGFAVSHKSACASEDESMSYVIKALGAKDNEATENIRVTLGRTTTKEDMKKFVGAVTSIYQKYSHR